MKKNLKNYQRTLFTFKERAFGVFEKICYTKKKDCKFKVFTYGLVKGEYTMEKIMSTNYLTVENFSRYRQIMRYFYESHRQMQGVLYRPEILAVMQEKYHESYGELEVDQDLANLVAWGNLQKQQELIRPKSIEEYRNKNFRYQITEAGILVEEMVYQLTHVKHAAVGELNEESFRHLLSLLQELVAGKTLNAELWEKIRQEFRQIGENTANYIGYITSPEVDSRMKTEAFLVYKDQFVGYLRDFIVSVQSLYYQFQTILNKLLQLDFTPLVQALWEKEKARPVMEQILEEEVATQFSGELKALQRWFLGTETRTSEYDNLMAQTNQMIAKMTSLIYYFGQESKQYQSRKKDYLHLATWFAATSSLADAQKMFAGIFGLAHGRNLYVTAPSEATNVRENSWELAPAVLNLTKRSQGGARLGKAVAVTLDSAAKAERQARYFKELAAKKEKIMTYFQGDCLDFTQIPPLDSASRRVFLRWIAQAVAVARKNASAGKITHRYRTELDFDVQITLDLQREITILCTDGKLQMPYTVMERKIKDEA